jgi:FKBP-type peptidyl-prolyl cis-trans isomerase (trigger factor)
MEVADFPVPQTLIDKELEHMMPAGKKIAETGKGEQENEYLKLMKERARNSVKSMLVFDHIRQEFKIEVSNDDLEKEYRQMADGSKYPLGEIRKYYADSERKDQLRQNLLNRKLLDFLREKIKVKVKEV